MEKDMFARRRSVCREVGHAIQPIAWRGFFAMCSVSTKQDALEVHVDLTEARCVDWCLLKFKGRSWRVKTTQTTPLLNHTSPGRAIDSPTSPSYSPFGDDALFSLWDRVPT